MSTNDERQARIDEIRASHIEVDGIGASPECAYDYEIWPCDAAWLLAELEAAQARAARAEAMVRRCADWFGVPLQEYAQRWSVDWMTATNDQMAADIRAALAEGA